MHNLPCHEGVTRHGLSSSVVVATYNRSQSLQRTFRALLLQEISPSEVIVVDDCSDDETPEVCRQWLSESLPFRFTPLRLRKNMGPAAARNFGVAHARGEIICFTDDDCEPRSDWIINIRKTFEDFPTLAGVGGPVVGAGDSKFDFFFDYHKLLDPKFENATYQPLYLVTANAAYLRAWVLRVGGFDEDIPVPGGEDPGLSFKILMAGGQLKFSKGMCVRHHYTSRLRSVYRMFRNYGYGAHLVSRAYPSSVGTVEAFRFPLAYFLKIAGRHETRSESPSRSLNSERLIPPYLSQIVPELVKLERDYSRQGHNFVKRSMMHVLWVVFRLAYDEGWREAGPISAQMPHIRLRG